MRKTYICSLCQSDFANNTSSIYTIDIRQLNILTVPCDKIVMVVAHLYYFRDDFDARFTTHPLKMNKTMALKLLQNKNFIPCLHNRPVKNK